VGFPGETNDDFEQTVELVRRVRYKNAFVFKYSPRPGTHSEKKLEDRIPAEVKQQRNVKLLEVISQIAEEDNKRFLGQTLEVLVEGPSKKPHLNKAENQNNPQLIGRTAHDYIVVFNGPESLTGHGLTVSAVLRTDKFLKNRAGDDSVKIFSGLYILCAPYLFHVYIWLD
jgi:tRNA-2-methylthio-N6-dimethylallyladenosine synthase